MMFPAIPFEQNEYKFITSVLPFSVINQHSHVLIYDKVDGGYQREPDEKHINNIKRYILDTASFLFPTSIVLGIDEGAANEIIAKEGDVVFLNLDGVAQQKLFRIVDGQHRIRGLAEAVKERGELDSAKLSVVILLTPEGNRSLEMEIFNTINSKSKRIKVDLIQLARYEYRILENKLQHYELNEHIAMQVSNLLNEDSRKGNVWFNAIKFGIHDDLKVGIIGVNAFRDSLKNIVNRYLQLQRPHVGLNGAELLVFAKDAGHRISSFVYKAWNEVIYEKWKSCFSPVNQELDFDKEIKTFYYNNKYYIQKTLGTKSLNYLLGGLLNEGDNNFENTLYKYKKIIDSSELLVSDWEVGNTFSGYSSESAFGKVSKMIKGEIAIPRS